MKPILALMLAGATFISSGCTAPGGAEDLKPSPHFDVIEPVVVPIPDEVNRYAVCVGLTQIQTGDAPCPGCDLDARMVAGWMEDRQVVLLQNNKATIESVKSVVRDLTMGIKPKDLLTISISGHGTTRPDASGDEANGKDEGLVLWDNVWWDDDVWDFICSLPPCRIELFTDTCHSEGNWRTLGRALTFGKKFKKEYVQLEFDFDDMRRSQWTGQIVQFAGCREESYSYGNNSGGTWTKVLNSTKKSGQSRQEWFNAAKAKMPANQEPAFTQYCADESFVNGEALR